MTDTVEVPANTPPVNDSIAHKGLEAMQGFLDALVKQWDEEYQTKSKWLWFFKAKVGLTKVARFIVGATDGLVVVAETVANPSVNGTVKKSAVIVTLDKLYDKVVGPNLPLPIQPFGWIVRYVVLHVVLSTIIDFVVSKYNQGNWNAEVKATEVKTLMHQEGISSEIPF